MSMIKVLIGVCASGCSPTVGRQCSCSTRRGPQDNMAHVRLWSIYVTYQLPIQRISIEPNLPNVHC